METVTISVKKNNQMEILELENTVTEVQGSTDSSDNSCNMAEESEMEERSVESIRPKHIN